MFVLFFRNSKKKFVWMFFSIFIFLFFCMTYFQKFKTTDPVDTPMQT